MKCPCKCFRKFISNLICIIFLYSSFNSIIPQTSSKMGHSYHLLKKSASAGDAVHLLSCISVFLFYLCTLSCLAFVSGLSLFGVSLITYDKSHSNFNHIPVALASYRYTLYSFNTYCKIFHRHLI